MITLDLKASYEPMQEASRLKPASSNPLARASGKNNSFHRVLNKLHQPNQKQQTEPDADLAGMNDVAMNDNDLAQAGKDAVSSVTDKQTGPTPNGPDQSAKNADNEQPEKAKQEERSLNSENSKLVLFSQIPLEILQPTGQAAPDSAVVGEQNTTPAVAVVQVQMEMTGSESQPLSLQEKLVQDSLTASAAKQTAASVAVETAVETTVQTTDTMAKPTAEVVPTSFMTADKKPLVVNGSEASGQSAKNNEQALSGTVNQGQNQQQGEAPRKTNEPQNMLVNPVPGLQEDANLLLVSPPLTEEAVSQPNESMQSVQGVQTEKSNLLPVQIQQSELIPENPQFAEMQEAIQPLLTDLDGAATQMPGEANRSDPTVQMVAAETKQMQTSLPAETLLAAEDAGNDPAAQAKDATRLMEFAEIINSNQHKASAATKSTKTNKAAGAGEEKSQTDTQSKTLGTEDLRLKLAENNMVKAANKTGKAQTSTDVKKLMLAESQRLFTAKPVATEETSTTNIGADKGQSESFSSITGLEKTMFGTEKPTVVSPSSTPQAAAQKVDVQDMIEQIIKKAEMISKDSNSEMKIQLKPEFMGKMIIKIAVEDGLVTAKFITESQHVKQVLEANLNSLKQNLESQGLKVDRTEVNVQLDNGGSFHGNESGREQMWQEYADRNDQRNRFTYQSIEDYQQGSEAGLESALEAVSDHAGNYTVDGRVDFMI